MCVVLEIHVTRCQETWTSLTNPVLANVQTARKARYLSVELTAEKLCLN